MFGGSSAITHDNGHTDSFDDLNTGAPSALTIKDSDLLPISDLTR